MARLTYSRTTLVTQTTLTKADGRRLRSERTRQAIIEAYLQLLWRDPTMPTAAQIAKQAGCSVRSLFERFADLDTLNLATADYAITQGQAEAVARNVEGDRPTRIRSHIETRAQACEKWLPLWRVILSLDQPELRQRAAMARFANIERMKLMYRPELSTLTESAASELLVALATLISFESWDQLRHCYNLSMENAQAAWRSAIDRMLPITPITGGQSRQTAPHLRTMHSRKRGIDVTSSPLCESVGRATVFGSHNLLSGLPPEYSSRLLARASTIDLAKGQALFQIGDDGDGCYWLKQGVLKVSIASQQGTERILAILGPGSIVGELAMIDGLPRSASVQALRDSSLIFVARSTFLACLRDSPELYAHLVGTLVARLRHADEEVAAASFLSLNARVARALLQFANYLGEPTATPDQVIIRHKLRQEDLAALADVARENASRILSEWGKRKIIVRQSPSVYVIQKSRLEREAGLTGKYWE